MGPERILVTQQKRRFLIKLDYRFRPKADIQSMFKSLTF
jgi:hypothetical protein